MEFPSNRNLMIIISLQVQETAPAREGCDGTTRQGHCRGYRGAEGDGGADGNPRVTDLHGTDFPSLPRGSRDRKSHVAEPRDRGASGSGVRHSN